MKNEKKTYPFKNFLFAVGIDPVRAAYVGGCTNWKGRLKKVSQFSFFRVHTTQGRSQGWTP